MKQRLLVMNGQRIVQEENGAGWSNVKVERAGEVRPGIYSLSLAKVADTSKQTTGVILHTDKSFVYQEEGRNIICHEARLFDSVALPTPGTLRGIKYEGGRAISEPVTQQQARPIKR